MSDYKMPCEHEEVPNETVPSGPLPLRSSKLVRHPAFDADGYPTAETLQQIVDWPYTDFKGLLDYVRPAVEVYGRMWEEKGVIKLATGGWSGNESIVGALQENRVFWAMCWESSHRGGLTVFRMRNFSDHRPARTEKA